ncbi:histidine kinase [alpha proteobacterium AAP81b]|nr:histidine kinase [alpha proteobacterium AAP81b]
MVALAAAWIIPVLGLGGYALDRVLVDTITRNFDGQLDVALTAMISAADIDEFGEVRFLRPLGDQRFFEPYSGLYWQVSAQGHSPFRSRSLWDRKLDEAPGGGCRQPCRYASARFSDEPLRVVGRTVTLPGSTESFYFQVAQSSQDLRAQIAQVRTILFWSLAALAGSLLLLTALQSFIGLWPLARVSRGIAAIRSGGARRVPMDVPVEVAPLVTEINELLDHNEAQAEAARLQAGNLAHALKTPMSVLIGETAQDHGALAETVRAQVRVMQRHVDHHLARARAAGRRGAVAARAPVWPAAEAVARTVERIHREPQVTVDLAGDRGKVFRGERQDLEEMVGNLVDNAAKYGGGRVFVTVGGGLGVVEILVEDDGPGIPAAGRARLFARGERLDTDKPGTGLGLAIVRDVAEIYGGRVALEESEDLGGLLARLTLPAAEG